MSSLNLSNLQVRPNILSGENYQVDMLHCSVFELRDIKSRNSNLLAGLPPPKQAEWRESLFWGDSPPPPVAADWAECLAGGLSKAVSELEERPTLEAAFECLLIARQLYNTRPSGPAKAEAAEWDRRVCVVLARDEFRHTPDMINQRLESILGHQLTAPAHPPIPPAKKPAPPAVVAGHTRQPDLFPAATEATAQAPSEIPAVCLASPLAGEVPPILTSKPRAVEESTPTPIPGEVEPSPSALPKRGMVRPTPGAPSKPTTTITIRDPDLKRLLHSWATLPDHVKKCVMMLLDAAEATQKTTK